MHPGNLSAALSRIQDALEELTIAWTRTREVWADQNAQAFEDNVMKPIAEEVTSALPGIGKIAETFGAALRDCEE